MRPLLLAAALLAVPLLSGCADEFATDAAPATATASAVASAELACVYLDGPGLNNSGPVDPGSSNNYNTVIRDGCGTIYSSDITISGDGVITSSTGLATEVDEPPYVLGVTVRAADVKSGSYVLTHTYQRRGTNGTVYDSRTATYTVQVGESDDGGGGGGEILNIPIALDVNLSNVTVTWDSADIPEKANFCQITVDHDRSGEGDVDQYTRRANCASGEYIDLGHGYSGDSLDLTNYTLKAYYVEGRRPNDSVDLLARGSRSERSIGHPDPSK